MGARAAGGPGAAKRRLRHFALVAVAAAVIGGAAPSISASVGSTLPGAESLARSHPSLRALVVARGGCVAFEYYGPGVGPQTRSPVYSVTKSVLSILVGIAIDQGLMRLDEPLADLVPEILDRHVDPGARNLAIQDLLTMTTGFDATRADPPATSLHVMLETPMTSSPGDHFLYSGVAADLLSVALSRAIKADALQFARRRLLDPLGIRNFSWSSDTQGWLLGETNLFLTARDMAKIGLLYLRRGRWGSRQIVSEGFVAQSTSRRNAGGPPLRAAYGYLWWITKTRSGLDAYFAAGSGGQLIYVVPELDLVAAISAVASDDYNLGLASDVVLAAETNLSRSTPCVARLDGGRPS